MNQRIENINTEAVLNDALSVIKENSVSQTDGKWLEHLTVEIATIISDWDVSECLVWGDWVRKYGKKHLPSKKEIRVKNDIGIDLVARRGGDGGWIAIQCKSHVLDSSGKGKSIDKQEIDSFISASANKDIWAERWLVTNGENSLTSNVMDTAELSGGHPIKEINLYSEVQNAVGQVSKSNDDCPHCQPNPNNEKRIQSKSCMQKEAVDKACELLVKHYETGECENGVRGKVILPCGTGKTRIAQRIIERLTDKGATSIVLCPSIALVAQIRKEFLANNLKNTRVMAVCSDDTAGIDYKKSDKLKGEEKLATGGSGFADDSGQVGEEQVKGLVTTDPSEISGWVLDKKSGDGINVIIGTYQSAHKLSEAIKIAGVEISVMVCDEAHRTAGIQRKKKGKKSDKDDAENQRIRNFMLCHDNSAFPTRYRVYQTATPRVYDVERVREKAKDDPAGYSDFVVSSMDEPSVFGIELFSKKYVDAVENGWLCDYRIVALGVNSDTDLELANRLSIQSFEENGKKNSPSTSDIIRGMAFALTMSGALTDDDGKVLPIGSCIAFLNSINKSKEVVKALNSDEVKEWVRNWFADNVDGRSPSSPIFEHIDSTAKVSARESIKSKLANGTMESPFCVSNVGIFGEGTDTPSLSAVGMLEARKSAIDLIQAVGRVMRILDGKEFGIIFCPLVIPQNQNAEDWLAMSPSNHGWKELGQVLLALRSHDDRIETKLKDMLIVRLPPERKVERSLIAIGCDDSGKPTPDFYQFEGDMESVSSNVNAYLAGNKTGLCPQDGVENKVWELAEPNAIYSFNVRGGEVVDARRDVAKMTKPKKVSEVPTFDLKSSIVHATKMTNGKDGYQIPFNTTDAGGQGKDGKPDCSSGNVKVHGFLDIFGEEASAIRVNLLRNSGIAKNKQERDVNLLRDGIKVAANCLREDGLEGILDIHFGLDNLAQTGGDKISADSCTIASLLLMNAAMLHQRVYKDGEVIPNLLGLSELKGDTNVVKKMKEQWAKIKEHDFLPMLDPPLAVISVIEESNLLSGLTRALQHISKEAEYIAETYADLGSDHAGALFNLVMGHQDSDGAFFTRPNMASLIAKLAIDSLGSDLDWSKKETWVKQKITDLACGSGSLLSACLTEMKLRASAQGVDSDMLAELQKIAVEDVLKGLDINPVSLQLAAAQLTSGSTYLRYKQMGLFEMPYGRSKNYRDKAHAGTLEVIINLFRDGELSLGDVQLFEDAAWGDGAGGKYVATATESIRNSSMIIMNPPFSNREKMGGKFVDEVKSMLCDRCDLLLDLCQKSDSEWVGVFDKNTIAQPFMAIADRCLNNEDGILTMVCPSIALTAPANENMRKLLAKRFHIETIVTPITPQNGNISQNCAMVESIVIGKKRNATNANKSTRVIVLDKIPHDMFGVNDLHEAIKNRSTSGGALVNGWGEVSFCASDVIESGNWSAAIWRSHIVANEANKIMNDKNFVMLGKIEGIKVHATGQMLRNKDFQLSEKGKKGSFRVIKSKGGDSQQCILANPDAYMEVSKLGLSKNPDRLSSEMKKAGHLLITAGQRVYTTSVCAIASDDKFVGNSWFPVSGLDEQNAKAISVFLNSIFGRLQLMSMHGKVLFFQSYSVKTVSEIKVPNTLQNAQALKILSDCWEETKDTKVPMIRNGDCEVRQMWDKAVCKAMGWNYEKTKELRSLFFKEPVVSGVAYGQYVVPKN